MNVAALFVQRRGVYSTLDVDVWDEARDARLYKGPHPVVAHPPCSRWCRLAGLVEARWGHKRGEDGGCFASALDSVRRWGGVLEHPAFSDAFAAHGISEPVGVGVWQRTLCGGWVARVDQGHFGHRAKKATWLYAYGVPSLPSLPSLPGECVVSWCMNRQWRGDDRPRITKREASATPLAFAKLLVELAASACSSRGSTRAEPSSSPTPASEREPVADDAGQQESAERHPSQPSPTPAGRRPTARVEASRPSGPLASSQTLGGTCRDRRQTTLFELRSCAWCCGPLRDDARPHALTCSKRCRQARQRRLARERSVAPPAAPRHFRATSPERSATGPCNPVAKHQATAEVRECIEPADLPRGGRKS